MKKIGFISLIASLALTNQALAKFNIKDFSAGYQHTFVIEKNGTLLGVGNNDYGQLGDGTTTSKTELVDVNTTTTTGFSVNGNSIDLNITAVSAGYDHIVALVADGTLWAWGKNNNRQLGDGTETDRTNPIQVHTTSATGFSVNGNPTDLNITAVSTGYRYTVALEANGTLWAWGDNNGKLGDGTTIERLNPVQVHTTSATGFSVNGNPTDLNITAVSTGYDHIVALEANGTLWAWGKNTYGQFGDGRKQSRTTPVEVNTTTATGFSVNGNPTDLNITAVSTGYKYTVALEANGTLWAWGNNEYGELGDGTKTNRTSPVEVNTTSATGFSVNGIPTNLNITAISAKASHTVALEANGTLWAWGDNSKGQLGDGTKTDRINPVEVNLSTSKGWYYDANITKISKHSRGLHTVAIDSNGTLIGWGENSSGELERGTTNVKVINPIILGTKPRDIKSTTSKLITWKAPIYDVAKYSIHRSASLSGTFVELNSSIPATMTSCFDTDIKNINPKTKYYYKIRAHYNQFGTFTEKDTSPIYIDYTTLIPTISSPTASSKNVGELDSETTIKQDILWKNNLSNISSIKLYYRKSSNNSWSSDVVSTTTATNHTLTNLETGTKYYVIVAESNGSIYEANSSVTSFTTTHTPPYNITGSATTSSITLSWSDGSFGNSAGRRGMDSTYYRIYKDGVVLVDGLPSSTTSYQIAGLSPSTTYKFIVSEYGSVFNRKRDANQEGEYKSTEVSFTTLAEPVLQTSLITSNIDSTATDEQKVKEEESDNSFVNSADLTDEDGVGTKVVLETPKEGSEVKNKTLTLEYNDNLESAKTTLATDIDVDVTVNIDGSFVASKSFEDKKVIANGDSKGETSISIENKTFKQNINIPKGADVKIENNIAKVAHTLRADTKEAISDMRVEIEADPNKSLTVKANYNNNGKEESTTYTTPSDVIESNVDFIPSNENGIYSGITATIKTKNDLSFNEEKRRNERILRTTTTIDPDTTTLIGTTAWQKYDERVYFDGRRTVTLLLGGANILRDGVEETMIKGFEYELIPSSSGLVASENTLTPIYTNSYLNIQKGWNLLSNPINEPINISTTFKYAIDTFKYGNSWIKNPTIVNQNEGIWVNYPKHVSEKIAGDSYYSDFTNAKSGWNLFGAGRDINLNELHSFNEVWAYSAKSKEWVKNPSIIYRGYGFWVK